MLIFFRPNSVRILGFSAEILTEVGVAGVAYLLVEVYLTPDVILHKNLEVAHAVLLEVVHLGDGCIRDDLHLALHGLRLRLRQLGVLLLHLLGRRLVVAIGTKFSKFSLYMKDNSTVEKILLYIYQ